ncbi:GNAT family N-acetyltransferase [Burkholderiaceae bacterium DAT-1]|nr:GNAT family N-acetyltransferase [Burkholderiaceae bacterium DAT-1]
MSDDIHIRPATPDDAPSLSAICLSTADAGQPLDILTTASELPGLLYALPYLHCPGAAALVAHDSEGIVGYAVGSPASPQFYDWMNTHWLPEQRSRFPQAMAGEPADHAWLNRLYQDWHAPEVLDEFPAHLHINLLPRARGKGAGRKLVETLLDHLHALGAEGVHWGVDPRNGNALSFYRKLGFEMRQAEPGCFWFASRLPHA